MSDVAAHAPSDEPNQAEKKPPSSGKPLSFLAALWPYLTRYKKIMAGAGAALIMTSMITLALGQGVRLVIDQGIVSQSISALNTMLSLVMLLVVAMAIGTFIRFYLVTILGERIAADIRNDVFSHLVRMHPNYFEENHNLYDQNGLAYH